MSLDFIDNVLAPLILATCFFVLGGSNISFSRGLVGEGSFNFK